VANSKGSPRVLVYGSLKNDCGNHTLMHMIKADYLGRDSITGDFKMISFGSYPGVVRTGDDTKKPKPPLRTIFGELYSINTEGLAALDQLESHPDFYERFKYRTDILDRNAWMYTLPGDDHYLNPVHFDQVDTCIWLPKDEEIAFWIQQTGIDILSTR